MGYMRSMPANTTTTPVDPCMHPRLFASFLKWKLLKWLFLSFLFFWLRHVPCRFRNACGQTSHTWLLSLPLSHTLPWPFFALVTGCHGFRSPCRLKTGGIKGGHFGDSWARLVPVAPCPAPSHIGGKRGGIVWGLELPVCQLITRGGRRGEYRGEGASRKSEGEKWKRK